MHRNYGAAADDSIPAKRQYCEQNAPSESTVKPRTALRCYREGHSKIDVSIILPVHNASSWLQECLQSVLEQDFHGNMELSIFNDASKDDSGSIIEKWTPRLENRGIAIVTSGHNSIQPKGVGYAKNQAVSQSRGKYLCFLDADDSGSIIEKWTPRLENRGIAIVTSGHNSIQPKGVGYAKNQAVSQSRGKYLCFLDAVITWITRNREFCIAKLNFTKVPVRDTLLERSSAIDDMTFFLNFNLQEAQSSTGHTASKVDTIESIDNKLDIPIIGCQVRREPEGSTERYTRWINGLTQSQLLTQGLSFYFIVLLWRIDSLLQDWKQDVELVTVVSFKNNGN
ncbi:UNVERIFIED_CONTAM: hypothetical protein FKN15_028058 [Acipenser sinensis]